MSACAAWPNRNSRDEEAMSDTTIIRGADWVVAWDAARRGHGYLQDVDVAFSGDTLTQIGKVPPAQGAREIDGRGFMVMPGFVDVHAHPSSEPMLKGLTDEVGSRKLWMSSLYEYLIIFQPDAAGKKA